MILWEDGKSYLDNSRYYDKRDKYIVEPTVKLVMQYRYLEKLIRNDGGRIKTGKSVRVIKI